MWIRRILLVGMFLAAGASIRTQTPPSNFAARCAADGVIRCVGFDDPADIAGVYGNNTGVFPSDDTTNPPAIDSAIYASGGGSLKFTIPPNIGPNAGSYFANFSPDLSVTFGQNSDFYMQWRQRFSPEFLNQNYAGGEGWKQDIIGTGDGQGCMPSDTSNCVSSCTDLEVVNVNSYQRGFAHMYNSCSGSTSHNAYDPFEEPFNSGDYKEQNAMPSPYCLYSQMYSLGVPTNPPGNCLIYHSNEWMTFQVHIHTGPRVADEWQSSHVDMWIAISGQPSVQVMNWGPYNLTAGDPLQDQKFGKVWLLPYNTNKDPTVMYATAYTWYDELIISRNRIADPN